ncbi:MAG: outer membrane protein assembly factor BamD [bacterium]
MAIRRRGERSPRGSQAAAAAFVLLIAGTASCGGQADFVRLTRDEQLVAARRDLAEREWSRAATRFQTLSGLLDGTPLYAEVKYGLGKSYTGLGDYPAAERELNTVIREYPDSEWADDALFTLAEALWDQSKPSQLDQTVTNQTIEKLREFINRYPESDRMTDAQALLAKARGRLAQKEYDNGALYLRLGDTIAARAYFASVLQEYADTEWAAAAQFGMAEADRKDGKLDAAADGYRAVASTWPSSELARRSEERLRELETKKAGS